METTIKNFKTAFVEMIDKMNEAHENYCANQMIHNEPVPDQPPQLALLISTEKDFLKLIDELPDYIKNYCPSVTPEILKKVVCEAFGVPEDVLFSRTRKREIVTARQCYIDQMLKLFKYTTGKVGEIAGGLDHATVIYSRNVVQNFMETEKEFRSKVEKIERKLKYRTNPQLQSVA